MVSANLLPEQADQLVAEVIQHVAEVFAKERSTLEGQWSQGGQADTEALRMARELKGPGK